MASVDNNKAVLPGLTASDRALQKRLLSEPLSFPLEFKKWVKGQSESDPPALPLTQMLGYEDLKTTATSTELAYVELTTVVTVTGATDATATPILVAPVLTLTGSRIHIHAHFPEITNGTTNQSMIFVLYDNGAAIGRLWHHRFSTNPNEPATMSCFLRPAAGGHIYEIRASKETTSGTPSVNADVGGDGKNLPGFLRISRAS